MANDVRASFDLNERPATESLRRIERAGASADATMEQLGRTIDDTFTARNREQVRAYERDLSSFDRTAIRTLGNTRREWRATEREVMASVAKQDAAITSLEGSLRSLGGIDARPNINLRGFAEANAELDIIEARLRALGGVTARPNVSLPTTRMAASAFGGGGGGRGGLNVPFAGSVPWPLVAGALAAAPPLVGGATSLIGSASSALLGAGAVGLSAGGVGAVAGGMGLPTTLAAISGMRNASKALADYQQQVIASGPNSKEARESLREFNAALREAPQGTRRFLHARTQLGQEFKRATRPAQADVAGIGTRGINVGRQLTPQFGRLSNQFFGEARAQAGNFGDFLAGDRSRAFYSEMGHEATSDLSFLENTSENVLMTMENIARAGRPFFHEGVEFLQDWTLGWRHSTHDIGETRGEIGQMVGDLKTWGHLAGATFHLTRDLLAPSRQPGTSMVKDLTQQLNEWDRWIKENPAQVRGFFSDSVRGTEKIATALGNITHMLWRLSQMMTPLLEEASQFVTFLDSAGLLSPGGLPLLLAGGAGVRNVIGGARGRILGTAGGGAAGGTAAEGLLLGGMLGGGGGAGAAARASYGGFGSTYGLARSFGYGRAASTVAEAGSFGGEAAGIGGTFLRGAGARFLPIAALMGGLQFASFPGSFGQRTQAAASSLTAGYVPMPKTGAQQTDEGTRYASAVADYYGRRYGSGTPAQIQEQIDAIRRKRHRLLLTQQTQAGFTIAEQIPAALGLIHGSEGPTGTDRAEAQALGQHLEGLRDQRRHQATTSALSGIQDVFGIRTRHGEDPASAFGKAATSIENRASRMKGRTKREFSQMGLDWARSMARSNPKLKDAVDDLSSTIERRLNRMGDNVRIIHGRIVDVSSESWTKVADLISSQSQRAYSEASENLTALEKRAMTILRNMGYSRSESKNLMYEAQHGHPSKAGAQATLEAHRHGMTRPTVNNMGTNGNATGGRLPMPASGSMHDVLNLGGGNMAAGGELMIGPNIANRHTERRIDKMLASFGTSLSREITMEGREHSNQFRRFSATGSIFGAGRMAQQMGLSVSGGPGFGGVPSSGHVSDSLHYQGLAYDVSGSAAQMRRYFMSAYRRFLGHGLNELFYDPMGWYVDEGHKAAGAIGGHSDHVHVGFFPGGLRGGAGMGRGFGRMGRMSAQQIDLHGLRSGQSGLLGAMVSRSNEQVASGLGNRLNELVHGGGRRGGANTAGGLDAWLSRALRITGHYSPQNLRLLHGRAMQESGGDPRAVNNWDSNAAAGHPSKGLLQTIPETFSAYREPGLGGIFNPVANAAAAINYMFSRYGHIVGPSSSGYSTGGRLPGFAGWYARGGHFRVHKPTLFGAGENGTEDVSVTPLGRKGGAGARPIQIKVDMRGAQIHGTDGAEKIGRKLGRSIAEELADALAASDGTAEAQLTG